jgi:hypothetical protein
MMAIIPATTREKENDSPATTSLEGNMTPTEE